MAQKRYGPTQGAGVAIIELEGDKPVQPGALGWAGYPGVLERGPVGELIVCPNQATFERKCGGYIEDSLLPDVCFDFFKVAAGAGGLLLVRVTDGNEVQAETPLYCRKLTLTQMGTLKAKNGGRWGGKLNRLTGEMTDPATELDETTFDTGLTMVEDEWVGAYLEFDDIANKRYLVVGNTAAGIVTVTSDSTMSTDYGAGTDNTWYLYHELGEKYLSYEVRDGEENPDSEFGLYIYLNGDLARSYPNLHTDPANSRYWENIINNDTLNEYVEAVDLWTGAHTADVRPANHYGEIDTGGVTETTLTAIIHEFSPAVVGDGDGTCALGTTTDDMVAQVITCTFTGAGTYDVSSDKFGALATGETVGVETDVGNKWVPPFTLTDGASAWEAADVAKIVYKPFVADSLEDGYLYPDKPNAKRERYRIESNTHKIITVVAGSDLTASGADGDEFMVIAPLPLEGGKDGNAGIVDADYINQAWDTVNSPFNQTRDKGYGLVKFATPGINATAVQQAGKAYAAAKNHQYRYEIPDTTVDEVSADEYVNDTLGRSDFCVVEFPSYGYVADPEGNGEGKLKLVPLTGKIHGREARIAVDYDGYHKAEAGIDAVLDGVLKLPTGDAILDEEYLNPKGINIVKKKQGNFVMWGDRTLWTDPNWKWKHQREMMSYYEQVLIESYDWIVFAINDPVEEKRAKASLASFFYPEWTKRALQGATFEEAATIKIDSENNTPATRAAGDMYADIKLWLADTVERFVIRIGKMGIFESVE
jgi:hypothetical protein